MRWQNSPGAQQVGCGPSALLGTRESPGSALRAPIPNGKLWERARSPNSLWEGLGSAPEVLNPCGKVWGARQKP